MYKGAYIALTGAAPKQAQMDLISHNIANVNTAGFKKDRIAFKEYLTTAVNASIPNEPMTLGENYHIATDFSSGPIVKTGNRLDVAIDGDGFFALELKGDDFARRFPHYLHVPGTNHLTPDGDDPANHTPARSVESLIEKGASCIKLHYEEALWYPGGPPPFRLLSQALIEDITGRNTILIFLALQ